MTRWWRDYGYLVIAAILMFLVITQFWMVGNEGPTANDRLDWEARDYLNQPTD